MVLQMANLAENCDVTMVLYRIPDHIPQSDISTDHVTRMDGSGNTGGQDDTEAPPPPPPPEEEEVIEEVEMEGSEQPYSQEEMKYLAAVRKDPSDFTGWTCLLQLVEQKDKLPPAREVFDSFLKHYPYCYGYWKKYADLVKRLGSNDEVIEVFDRGVTAIPLSVDLWIHYSNYMTQLVTTSRLSNDLIRSVYQRAVVACGLDYRSDRLWNQYVDWEQVFGDTKKVLPIYDQMLATPTQTLSLNFEKFLTFLEIAEPEAILSEEDLAKLMGEGQSSESYYGDRSPKEIIVEQQRSLYNKTEVEVEKRKHFEEAIRRPYFHVKPLEKSQLKNWRDYLDYEIKLGNQQRIVFLFERCMVACALYEDMWIKFAGYCERVDVSLARDVYSRACGIHLSKKPSMHLSWAVFEEKHGNFDGAREALKKSEDHLSDYVLLRIHRIALEIRQKNMSAAEELYKQSIASCRHWDREARCFWVCRYARFMSQIVGDMDAARNILLDAIEHDKTSGQLYLQLLGLELWLSGGMMGDITAVEKVFSLVEKSALSEEAKQGFARRRLQLMEEYSPSLTKLREAYDSYSQVHNKQVSKKRSGDGSEEQQGTKKMKNGSKVSSATAVTSGAVMDGNQWSQYQQQWTYPYNTTQSQQQQQQSYANWAAYQQYYGPT
ncbi:pre-mRNA-processing factor 39-like isoform X2 [Dysidea avara]|uniref:pre-mRNA-processing factor 39-like isoform X2 n=1 Tax=Dysidea avara TaxID=196820 RepID=UPI003324668D